MLYLCNILEIAISVLQSLMGPFFSTLLTLSIYFLPVRQQHPPSYVRHFSLTVNLLDIFIFMAIMTLLSDFL